jgi:hypothetical protein
MTGAPVFVFICAVSISAQWNKKPYTEWSEKEATKLLNDSPWGQTQVFSDTSNEFGTGVARGPVGTIDNRSGDYSAHHLNIRIRFLSAKPIRQAFSRRILLAQKGPVPDQMAAQLKAFATQDFPDYIIVSVDCDANESKNEIREFRSLLDTTAMADLKNDTYLSAKGQRTFIASFQPPKKDGLGAKFIFPRTVNGKPTIPPDSDEIQFYSEFSNKYKLNMRFRVKDMMVDGKLEY